MKLMERRALMSGQREDMNISFGFAGSNFFVDMLHRLVSALNHFDFRAELSGRGSRTRYVREELLECRPSAARAEKQSNHERRIRLEERQVKEQQVQELVRLEECQVQECVRLGKRLLVDAAQRDAAV